MRPPVGDDPSQPPAGSAELCIGDDPRAVATAATAAVTTAAISVSPSAPSSGERLPNVLHLEEVEGEPGAGRGGRRAAWLAKPALGDAVAAAQMGRSNGRCRARVRGATQQRDGTAGGRW